MRGVFLLLKRYINVFLNYIIGVPFTTLLLLRLFSFTLVTVMLMLAVGAAALKLSKASWVFSAVPA